MKYYTKELCYLMTESHPLASKDICKTGWQQSGKVFYFITFIIGVEA